MKITFKDILIVIALILGGIALLASIGGKEVTDLGATSHISGPLDSTAGYYVGGKNFVDSSKNVYATTVYANDFHAMAGVKTVTWSNSAASTADQTLTTADICDYQMIDYSPSRLSTTTFPSSSAAFYSNCLPIIGSNKTILIRNTATTDASSTILAMGSGGTFFVASGTQPAASTTWITGGERQLLDIYRTGADTYSVYSVGLLY